MPLLGVPAVKGPAIKQCIGILAGMMPYSDLSSKFLQVTLSVFDFIIHLAIHCLVFYLLVQLDTNI